MKNSHRPSESGNVLFYILIAISLIAALSYAIMHGNRGGTQSLNQERVQLTATQILEYADVLGNASAQLRLRGCRDTELRFTGGPAGTYTNANAPSDSTCDIFNTAGGGVNFQEAPGEASAETSGYNAIWTITGNMAVENIGSAAADLLVVIPDILPALCEEINTVANVADPSTTPVQADASWNTFQGSYSASPVLIGGTSTGTENLAGKNAGCFQSTNNAGVLFFYKVLVAR